MEVLRSNSMVICVITTLVERVKYLLGVVPKLKFVLHFVAPVGIYTPVIKKKQFIIVYSAEVNKYFDSKSQFNIPQVQLLLLPCAICGPFFNRVRNLNEHKCR